MLTSREAKELRALRTTRGRRDSGRFLAEGIRVVEDLLDSPVPVLWVLTSSTLEDDERGADLVRELDRRGIIRRVLPAREFVTFAATDSPQGVVAVAETPRARLEFPDEPGRSVVLVLDAVQDPGNFGTLVRSAEALGARGLIVLPGTVDPWNAKAVRSAAGSSFRLPIAQSDWQTAERILRDGGYAILGARAGGIPISKVQPERAALVVGNEGAGLSSEVRAGVDEFVGIPLHGRAESLNVAAAAAILLYELVR